MDPLMRDARVRLIARLHEVVASGEDPEATNAYESWSEAALPVRGPLERKRVADRDVVGRIFGEQLFKSDISFFVFAVETYLAVRAHLLVHVASSRLLQMRATSPDDLESALFGQLAQQAGLSNWRALSGADWILRSTKDVDEAILRAEVATAEAAIQGAMLGPTTDLLGADHQALIPKQLRHAIGAYYTPHWLARFTLKELGYDTSLREGQRLTLLDPACGSGVFLMAAADEVRRAIGDGWLDPIAAISILTDRLIGCDIDPLAVVQVAANLSIASLIIAAEAGLDSLPKSPSVYCMDSLSKESDLPNADFLVGNPPWVNWEYLPPEYRERHAGLWQELRMFDLQGRDRAFSKEDVSALFFANSLDRYLRNGGRIAFLVPQSLVKAALNHRGFRKFELRNGSVPYAISHVADFVAVKPFEGVSNRTILLVGERGKPMKYPVPYRRWTAVKDCSKSPAFSGPLDGTAVEEVAEPSDPTDLVSHWMNGSLEDIQRLHQLNGESSYRARTGVFTGGANGVFHLDILATEDGILQVRNITERAKRAVPQVEARIESEFVYPFLRGRDVQQWRYEWSAAILLPHTAESRMKPVNETELVRIAPLTMSYLRQFREQLDARKGFVGWERQHLADGFYACQRVGDYTFSPWKVVWRYIAPTFTTAVVGPCRQTGLFLDKPLIPNEKLMMIACSSSDEAYYLGGLLASSPVVRFVESRMVSTQIAPHVIRGLRLPTFDPTDPIHCRVRDTCLQGHDMARSLEADLSETLEQLDADVAQALGIDAPAQHLAVERVDHSAVSHRGSQSVALPADTARMRSGADEPSTLTLFGT